MSDDEQDDDAATGSASPAEIGVARSALLPDVIAEAEDTARVALQWDARKIRTTDMQLFAAGKDMHIARRLEELAALMLTDSDGPITRGGFLRSNKGQALLKSFERMTKTASDLRLRAIEHCAKRDEWIMAGRGASLTNSAARDADEEPEGVDPAVQARMRAAGVEV